MGDFKKLIAWQKANELARDIHSAFRRRRAGDYTGLRAQILRAAQAVPANLAEGCGKRSRKELARFAETAYTSVKEVEANLVLSRDVDILARAEFEYLTRKTDEVARLCFGLMRDRPPPDP